jgi:hypothetical protein
MKEQDIIDLGFKKEIGQDGIGEFYYYDYDFGRGLSLISNANDEAIDSKWFVDVFEEDNIRFTTKEDLEIFINIVNKNKKL